MSSTNLTDFRNQYLAKVKGRLTSADITNASDTDLILKSALLRAYDSVNRFDPIGPEALSLLQGMTGEELESYLQDGSNRGAFEQLLASSTAMTAVAASSTAMNAVAASATAMNAILKSSTARAAICATGTPNTNLQATRSALLTTLADASKFTKVLNSATQDGGSSFGGATPAWGTATAAELIVVVEKAGPWSSGSGAKAMWRHLQDTSYEVGSSNTGTYKTTVISSNAVCIGGIQYTESGDAGIIVSAWKAI